jgi:hypothetical protein
MSETCRVQSYVVSTTDAGVGWSAPEPLGSAQPLDAFPQSTAGRFLGDYVSTSFVAGGVAVPVFAAAAGPLTVVSTRECSRRGFLRSRSASRCASVNSPSPLVGRAPESG